MLLNLKFAYLTQMLFYVYVLRSFQCYKRLLFKSNIVNQFKSVVSCILYLTLDRDWRYFSTISFNIIKFTKIGSPPLGFSRNLNEFLHLLLDFRMILLSLILFKNCDVFSANVCRVLYGFFCIILLYVVFILHFSTFQNFIIPSCFDNSL